MNFLFLSPQFPPNFRYFCQALQSEGVQVLGIGDCPVSQLDSEVVQSLTDYRHVPEMMDFDAVAHAAGRMAEQYGRIDRIDSHNEYWLPLEAHLRSVFDVTGPKPDAVAASRSKMGMKHIFMDHGIPCAPGCVLHSADDARRFVQDHGLPVIIKPEIGVGATNTFKVTDHGQLEQALTQFESGYVIESFIDGELVTFDGLADEQCRPVFAASMHVGSGVMQIVESRQSMHYYYSPLMSEALWDLGCRTLGAFGVRERFFHIEFFRRHDYSYTILEINIRPPGGYSLDMMNRSADIDLYRYWAQLIAHGHIEPVARPKYYVMHVARRHGLSYYYQHDQIVEKLGAILVDTLEVPAAFAVAMGDVAYMIRSEDLPVLEDARSMIQAPG